MIKYIIGIAFFVFTLLNSSCKNEGCNMVLNSVSFRTTLNNHQASIVKVQYGWTYADGGNCGLIVYNTGEHIVAYDRCSADSKSKLVVEGFQAIDMETGSKWLLLDGSPSHMSDCSLIRYNAQTIDAFVIISN
jgi:hypothetical protein